METNLPQMLTDVGFPIGVCQMAKNGDVFDCYNRDTRRTSSDDVFYSAGDTAEAGVIQSIAVYRVNRQG